MGRNKRYTQINESQVAELANGYKYGESHVYRQRCQAVLLNSQGKSIRELCAIFQVLPNTIINWLDRWENKGLKGLETQPGQGRKPKIRMENKELVEQIKSKVRASPKQLTKVLAELDSECNLSMSRDTLKRFLKKTVGDGNVSDDI